MATKHTSVFQQFVKGLVLLPSISPLSYTLDQSLFSIPLTHLINRDFGFTPLLISGVLAGIGTGMTELAISVDKAELKTYPAVSKKT